MGQKNLPVGVEQKQQAVQEAKSGAQDILCPAKKVGNRRAVWNIPGKHSRQCCETFPVVDIVPQY